MHNNNMKRKGSSISLDADMKRARGMLDTTIPNNDMVLSYPSLSMDTSLSMNITRKASDILCHESSASSVISYASTASTAGTTTTSDSSIITPPSSCWLPPISSLLPTPFDEKKPPRIDYYAPQMPQQHVFVEKKNKKKQQQQKQQKQPARVYMPMIPYFFHHKQFGIEACMLQLEGQKKFSYYYYI